MSAPAVSTSKRQLVERSLDIVDAMRRNGDTDEHDAFTEVALDERATGIAADIAEPAAVRRFFSATRPARFLQ